MRQSMAEVSKPALRPELRDANILGHAYFGIGGSVVWQAPGSALSRVHQRLKSQLN
jgi:hypothetical protein